jgi:type III secretion protein V
LTGFRSVQIIRVMGKDVLSKVAWLSRYLGVGVAHGSRLSPYSGLAVTTLVALSVGMMIVPLPTFLLDLAISLNIAIAVTMLLLAIHVGDALRIATFPSLLLLTTLFRLSIEVSATRLILLKANAGEVIHAFGSFVVAGNLVVGVVVFFILTVVQFIVVAKGAERVSEVGARFTLDALPGKQMAIDAELRAGHIHLEEAHKRRILLTRESQFFGAMDGAMKFVKGDAIAGIVILLTNIVGGLVIGVLQHGLDIGIAVRTYTLLTIGEGLVAQIPALIISTAAGIIVTRVSSEEGEGHLGSDIARQVLAQPKALASSAVLLAVLAIVPGLPALPFLVLASGLGTAAFVLIGRERKAATDGPPYPATAAGALLVPIGIDLGPGIAQPATLRLRQQWLPQLREHFFDETGITLPEIRIREVSSLPRGDYAIRLHETVVATAHLASDAGEGVIVDELLRLLRRYGHELVGIEATQTLLDGMATTHKHLLRETVPKVISTVLLAEILQCLAKEGVSLRYLARILECLAKRAPLQGSAAELADVVRASLRREITGKFVAADGSLRVVLLDPTIEETVRESIQKRDADTVLAIEPDLGRDIVSAVGRMVDDAGAPVIVTAADIRRHLRALIEVDHPNVAVLAFQEILPEVKLETVGHVTVPA